MPAPKKYDVETQARAVRMYLDRMAGGGVSQFAARREVGELLGINQSTMRNWIRRADDEDAGRDTPAGLEAENARLRAARTRNCGASTGS